MWPWQIMKVNEMVMYVSEMKWYLYDNCSHQNQMAFIDMRMKMKKDINLEAETQCFTFADTISILVLYSVYSYLSNFAQYFNFFPSDPK